MEFEKIMNLMDHAPNQSSKFKEKNWVETMLMQVKRITLIVKLNLKVQCYSQVYVIIVMHTYL